MKSLLSPHIFILSLALLLTACGGGSKSEDSNPSAPIGPPVKKTLFSLISRTRVPADGLTDLIAKVRITTEARQPVPKFALRLLIPREEGVNLIRCEESDLQGISTCVFRAHKPGRKTMTVADTDQSFFVEFTGTNDPQAILFDVVSGAHGPTAAGTDVVRGTSGKRYSVPVQESGTNLVIHDVSVSN